MCGLDAMLGPQVDYEGAIRGEGRSAKHIRCGYCGLRFGSKADMCSAKRHVSLVPIADIGPSTHLAFWPSLIQELPTGSAGAFFGGAHAVGGQNQFRKKYRLPAASARDRP